MKKGARNLIGDLLHVFAGNKQDLHESEYDRGDVIVDMFFKSVEASGNKDNVKTAFVNMDSTNPDLADKIIDNLEKSLELESILSLRYSYHNLVKSSVAENDAIILEDLNSNIEDLTPVQHRLEAAKGLEKYASLNPDQTAFVQDLESLILEGSKESVQSASNLIKTVFSSKVPQSNVRLAYTSLSTQPGEPYQMCPKAQKQIGWAIPMELSKCRDNCIDSRKTKDGKVSCAYQDWLRVVADNQESVMERLNAARIQDNEGIKTLNEITRPGPADDEKPREQMLEESDMVKEQKKYYKQEDVLENSIEKSLESRDLNTKQSSSGETRITTAASKINNKEVTSMSNKFNLQQHITGNSINDKLDQYRAFFEASFEHESPSQLTNRPFDNSKYEKATSMEALIEEKRTGSPEAETVLNEQLSKVQKDNAKVTTTTQEETLNQRRKNEPLDEFMKTLEEKLEARRHSK